MTLLRSDILDAHYNLAVEELLLEQVERFAPALFLWRSGPGVVVGKNQNPWRECRTDLLAAEGITLARRVSGGGTVYHDPGNLNFTLVVAREAYDEARQFALVRRALRALGVQAELLNRSSLAVDGSKVSGNAFCFRRGAALHHGTLLIDADLTRLRRYLAPPEATYRTHAIASIPAPVENLSVLCPGLERRTVEYALCSAFRAAYGGGDEIRTVDAALLSGLADRRERFASAAWRLGRTPAFTVAFSLPEGRGARTAELQVRQGRVTEVLVDGTASAGLTARLAGCRYDAALLARRLEAGDNALEAGLREVCRRQRFCWV